MDVAVVTYKCPVIMKSMMGLYHRSLKVVVFMMELHHGSSKGGEASVKASLHGFPHSYELVSSRFHMRE